MTPLGDIKNIGELDGHFAVEGYGNLEDLEPCGVRSRIMKAFPLQPVAIDNEFPLLEDAADYPEYAYPTDCTPSLR